ncbi:MAG: phosphatidate cytidylyltransferase [Planctomycetota bacterium]
MLKRTLVGLTLLLILVGAWWFDRGRPQWPALATAVLGGIAMVAALDELLRLGTARPARRAFGRLLGVIWLALVVLPMLVPQPAPAGLRLLADLLTAGSITAAAFLALQLPVGPGSVAHRLAGSLWFQVPYVGGLACLVALLLDGALDYAVGVVVVAKASDIGAYFTGRLFGRHKLAPRISPGKTVEGAIGGLLFSAAVGAWLLSGVVMRPERVLADGSVLAALVLPGGAWGAAAFGLVLGALAIIADLAESLLKRSRALKDSGRVFGQAGGFLDLVDSLLLVGPVALAYTAILG